MTFTANWKPRALDQLADIWLASGHRAGISTAADQIDAWLRNDPQSKGESRSTNRRILVIPPLAFVVEIQELDRIVQILSVTDMTRELP